MIRRKNLCELLDIIDTSLSEKLTLDMLSRLSGYSTVQITRLFNEFVGITPMRYIGTMRIIRAAGLLRNTQMKITDIAFECGFESLEVFERAFKKYFYMTAAEFRKNSFTEPEPFYVSAKIYYERIRRNMLIDKGTAFDWGKTAIYYAKFRDIYPRDFFERLHKMLGNSKNVLDIGTGTGILPYNMAAYGGAFTGIDKSREMIEQARAVCKNYENVKFIQGDAHILPFENNSFDAITALQCWVYFDKEILIPELLRVLGTDGELYIMFMTWLPEEDEVIRKSFELVRKYNPNWSGFMKRFDIHSFDYLKKYFIIDEVFKKDYYLQFTKENWIGRMTASRGVGAALDNEKTELFKKDMSAVIADNELSLLHEAVIVKLRKV